jgi:DNA-binding MarR family transcriptional regulator
MPPPDTLDFLLAQVSHLHFTRLRQLLENLGLYRGQPLVLRELWEQEGRTHTELAAALQVTPATMTKTLQRMEKQGFLQRRPDPTDQRVSRVYLTESGRAVQREVENVFQTIERETFRGLSQQELDTLRRFLSCLRENLLEVTSLVNPVGQTSTKNGALDQRRK